MCDRYTSYVTRELPDDCGGQLSLTAPPLVEACTANVFTGTKSDWVGRVVAIGVEYYASIGPIARPAAWNDQSHYLYEAVDLLGIRNFELNVGIGEGLTGASNAVVAKLIVGYAWAP